jgi:uncharacterized repeat protein (TIGR01451 family)
MMSHRLRGVVGSGICAAALVLLYVAPAGAVAAEGSPAWAINQVTAPTNLIPGTAASGSEAFTAIPRWTVLLTNVGDATTGTAPAPVVTDILPAGVTVAPGTEPAVEVRNGAGLTVEPCTVSGQTVSCEITRPTPPGELVQIQIPLAVSATAADAVVNALSISGGGAPPTSGKAVATVGPALPSFGFLPVKGLRIGAFGAEGLPPSAAGSHPFMIDVAAEFNSSMGSQGFPTPREGLRNLKFDLPGGVVADPAAVPVRCTTVQLASGLEELSNPAAGCPIASQVGIVYVEISNAGRGTYPLYDMVPPPGHPAELAFSYDGVITHVLGGLGGDFHLTAEASDLLTKFPIVGVDAFLWGVPSDPAHDSLRFGQNCKSYFGCSMESTSPAPFLTLPSSCAEPMGLQGTATSWLGTVASEKKPLTDLDGNPIHLTDCGSLAFEPGFAVQATTEAGESPSGIDVAIHQAQDESLEGRATSTLKDVKVTLPEGMTLNAAAGDGLEACTEGQMGYTPEEGKVRFSTVPQSCPNAAKVGTIEATTPLLQDQVPGGGKVPHLIPGSVYVAKPFDNPFGSLLAVYLAIEDRKSGIVAKLAGKVEPDPRTGQLTATFTENPELPLEDIHVDFFSGENATLTTPLTCGTKITDATLTPWSTPEGADVKLTDSFGIANSCSTSEAAAPKTNTFTAGTVSPLSGTYSPFVLRISRPDGSQHITGIETTLPGGLLGKLAGISYCPESGIAQAISREEPEKGKLEQQSPSCPGSSEVGTVNVTAGSGSNPIPVSGHAYLAGPYKGAPVSLIAIVPAVAGPFDLGTVVDRVALNVGEYDARIHAVADPLPTIREGIPLDVRSIELKLDRPDFTLNPTSCEAKAIEGSVATQPGQSLALKNRFQVGECGRLAFKPKLQISLKGPTKRTGHPALKATVTYPKKGAYANIARAQVNLPHSEFLDQGNIGKSCTKPVLAARACPAKSIYGKVKAWSPLLEKPLEGPVYLVGGYGYKLPALVAELNGQIRVLLVGKVDTGKNHGIRNTFEAVPDAPVEKFVLEMKGGKKYGLLENSEDICTKKQVAGVALTAQNGRADNFSAGISNSCGKGKKKHKKPKPHH